MFQSVDSTVLERRAMDYADLGEHKEGLTLNQLKSCAHRTALDWHRAVVFDC